MRQMWINNLWLSYIHPMQLHSTHLLIILTNALAYHITQKNIVASVDQCEIFMNIQGYHCKVYSIPTHEDSEVDFD